MIDDEILKLLRESPAFLSGEEISRRLKVSRTAVWKRIHRLRSLGYELKPQRDPGTV